MKAVSLKPQPADSATSLAAWLADFAAALSDADFEAAARLFTPDCYWRDLLAFSWTIKTVEGPEGVRDQLTATAAKIAATRWTPPDEDTQADGVIEGWFVFETQAARCRGHIRLRDGRCWTLFTAVTELKSFEEKRGRTRPLGTEHRAAPGRETWLDARQTRSAMIGREWQPQCVIIGGGQSGIILAARLRRLGVAALVIDRNPRPGDVWRNRYKTLCLHDPVWYDHLPYLPFPDDWPVFTPKDKMADWLESYVGLMELDYWSSTECQSAMRDEATGEWVVHVLRGGTPATLRTQHVVVSIGLHGSPFTPEIAGQAQFKGVQHHSSDHRCGPHFRGKKCVVLGGNNSAHDICQSLWENGADVTMLQRSPTTVVPSDALLKISALYSEDAVERGVDVETADDISATVPFGLLAQMQASVYETIRDDYADYYDRLTRAGLKIDFGMDGSGLYLKALRDGGGYYIDVGAAELIADGRVAVRNSGIEQIKARSVVLTDGSELPADVIVYATGYSSLSGPIASIFGQSISDQLGATWGMGSGTRKDPGPWEGELRNQWKPTPVPNLWINGGNLALVRYYSRFLALQIKARLEAVPTPVFDGPGI